jgi:hypothetical protein
MPKQRTIRLYLDNTFEEKSVKFDGNKLKPEKNDEVTFEPICVFSERKPRFRFWRGTRRLAFFVDGCVKALRFGTTTEEFQTYWTKKEARELVHKEIAKALTEYKPIKTWQFVVIIGFLLVQLLVLIRIANILGAL